MSGDRHQQEGGGEKGERWKWREKRGRDWSFPLQLLKSTSCLSGKILRGQISSDKTRAQCFNMHTGTEQAVKGDTHTHTHWNPPPPPAPSRRRDLRNLKFEDCLLSSVSLNTLKRLNLSGHGRKSRSRFRATPEESWHTGWMEINHWQYTVKCVWCHVKFGPRVCPNTFWSKCIFQKSLFNGDC